MALKCLPDENTLEYAQWAVYIDSSVLIITEIYALWQILKGAHSKMLL